MAIIINNTYVAKFLQVNLKYNIVTLYTVVQLGKYNNSSTELNFWFSSIDLLCCRSLKIVGVFAGGGVFTYISWEGVSVGKGGWAGGCWGDNVPALLTPMT